MTVAFSRPCKFLVYKSMKDVTKRFNMKNNFGSILEERIIRFDIYS
uniref:Beta-galactosidase n=1 Tax=Rhizophora mucronata TaxID=61149 RepID=A0A2P2J1I9_RHIMU